MKILFLMKRQYMSRDIIDEKFGRYWDLMFQLNKLGHEVYVFCLSYQDKEEGYVIKDDQKKFFWFSMNAGLMKPLGFRRYLISALKEARHINPDIIYCCSDPLYIIGAEWLASQLKIKWACDVYDNLRTYAPYKIPGVNLFFNRAIRKADGITPISEIIADDLKKNYRVRCPMQNLSNGINPNIFFPQPREACRKKLGLPEEAQIIGTTGALFKNRGINLLFEGYQKLALEHSNIHLALSGPCDQVEAMPKGQKIHYYPNLPREDVGVLMNALDVNVICTLNNPFGIHSFPQKTYEMIACQKPLAVASVGIVSKLLKNYPECLYEPDNLKSFINIIKNQLKNPRIIDLHAPSWADIAKTLESFLLKSL